MYEQNHWNGGAQQDIHQTNQKIHRSVSNTNVSNQRGSDCHVEYEVSVPIIRHAPYHSLWNLHQW